MNTPPHVSSSLRVAARQRITILAENIQRSSSLIPHRPTEARVAIFADCDEILTLLSKEGEEEPPALSPMDVQACDWARRLYEEGQRDEDVRVQMRSRAFALIGALIRENDALRAAPPVPLESAQPPVVDVSPLSPLDFFAASVLQGLMANPQRYDYIAEKVVSGELSQEEATAKNVHKAYLIAEAMVAEKERRAGLYRRKPQPPQPPAPLTEEERLALSDAIGEAEASGWHVNSEVSNLIEAARPFLRFQPLPSTSVTPGGSQDV